MADQSQYWQQQQQQPGGWGQQQPYPGGWPPQQPPQTPGAGGEAVLPPPKAPTPLDPPAVFYNKNWRVAPLVVDTQEAADALDPNEWTSSVAAGPAAGPADKPQWPQLYYNVNVSPRIVNDAKEAKSLGDEWKQFSLPDALCKAAEAMNAQAQAKRDAAAQKQQPSA